MTLSHLDKLLFVQGNACFFCKKPLSKANASVEHLLSKAKGGTNEDGNCVACCKGLNAIFADLPLKAKMEIVLNQRGNFLCPYDTVNNNAANHEKKD